MAQNAPAEAPLDRLKSEAKGLLGALGDRAVTSLRDRVEDTAGRLIDFSDGVGEGGGAGMISALTGAKDLAQGKSPMRSLAGAGMAGLKEKVSGMFGKGGGSKGSRGKGLKVTNIVEQIDVGAPVDLTYNLWTRFTDFPSFMKKVENVEQAEDETLNWKAQILWSHRNWEATILEQTPDEKIIWRSKGAKGYVDGAVTFHELAPRLTRILLVLEYHPQGFFEHTGNLWRAQGRRARLELKHFRRHLMSEVLLHPDEIEGWRGVIKDSQVVDQENGEGEEVPHDDRDADDLDADDRDTDDRDAEDRDTLARDAEDRAGRGDRGHRAARTERAARTDRDRQRRGPGSQTGSGERTRRPTDEPRHTAPRQRSGGERSGGETSGGERSGRERSGGERSGRERSGRAPAGRRSAGQETSRREASA